MDKIHILNACLFNIGLNITLGLGNPMASYLQIFRLKLFYACLVSSIRAVFINKHKHSVKNARCGYSSQLAILSPSCHIIVVMLLKYMQIFKVKESLLAQLYA
jgi:hypothetical protein